jgi:hypothetical protein
MKPTYNICRLLLQGIFVLFCLFALHSIAQADMIDDIASVLRNTGEPLQSSIGITSAGLTSFKDYINCMGNGNDIMDCTDRFLKTATGQQLDVPDWVTKAIDLYIDVKEGAYWEIYDKYGEKLACALAIFFTGVDICGTAEVMAQTAETVYDAANAVVEFFAALGDVAYDVAKAAWCGVFGCDSASSPGPSPQDVAYANFFAPSVANREGLRAIELDEKTFQTLVDTLKQKAMSNFFCLNECLDKAVEIFRREVDTQWTGDIGARVLKELGGKRNDYNTDQQIAGEAQFVCNNAPTFSIPSDCNKHFRTDLGYVHVDRWISQHAQDAQRLGAKSNEQWCKEIFWDGNKSKFAAAFRNCIKNKCPETGQKLLCSSPDDFNNCKSIMAQVGQDTQCDFTPESALKGKCLPKDIQTQMFLCSSSDDYKFCGPALTFFHLQDKCGFTASAAYESAKKLDNYFKANGSKIPCNYTTPAQPNKPADFVCIRPKQKKACDQYHESPFVNCVLNEDSAYIALKEKVNQVVTDLRSNYSNWRNKCNGLIFGIDDVEPLLAYCSYFGLPDQYKNVISENFGFGPPSIKTGFDILQNQKPTIPFDGLSTPAMYLEPPDSRCLSQPTPTTVDRFKPMKPIPDPKNMSPGISPTISPTAPTKR